MYNSCEFLNKEGKNNMFVFFENNQLYNFENIGNKKLRYIDIRENSP